jgi:citrate synthase
MQEHVGTKFTDKDVSDYLWSTLKSGRVVPGYGHAVLRKPDPRFEALMDYASSRPEIAKDPVFQLVKKNSEIAPEVLKEHGKTKVSVLSPDLISGQLPFTPIAHYNTIINTLLTDIFFNRTPIPMSTPALEYFSTTMDSTRLCTIPRHSVSAEVWDLSHS